MKDVKGRDVQGYHVSEDGRLELHVAVARASTGHSASSHTVLEGQLRVVFVAVQALWRIFTH